MQVDYKFRGITGKRSGLWRQMLSTIRLVRPDFAILENVAMLLHRGMGTALGGLAESGYDAEWDCISAFDVGAPHQNLLADNLMVDNLTE